jgi:hypothetical protein
MRTSLSVSLATAFFACGLGLLASNALVGIQATRPPGAFSRTYVGFDRNRYPGDSALKLLRQNFSFSGYWLNAPPNETSDTWEGKRELLTSNGFGFLLLFNGRLYRELKAPADPIRVCVDRRSQRLRVSSGSLLLRNPSKRGGRNDNYYRERFTG